MKAEVSDPVVETESPTDSFRSLGPPTLGIHMHAHKHIEVPGESHRLTQQTHVIRAPYRYTHRTEHVDTQNTHIPRHTQMHI